MSHRLNRSYGLLVVFAAIIALIAGCSGASSGSDADSAVAAGKTIYQTGGASGVPCATCHTTDGSELVGPSFQGLAERAGSRIEGLSAEDYVLQSIHEPNLYIVEGYDPAMPEVYATSLSEEDISNVAAYVLSLP